MKFREIEKILVADGWYLKKTSGSHHQYKRPTEPGKVTMPRHVGDLDKDTVNSILRQAGLK